MSKYKVLKLDPNVYSPRRRNWLFIWVRFWDDSCCEVVFESLDEAVTFIHEKCRHFPSSIDDETVWRSND